MHVTDSEDEEVEGIEYDAVEKYLKTFLIEILDTPDNGYINIKMPDNISVSLTVYMTIIPAVIKEVLNNMNTIDYDNKIIQDAILKLKIDEEEINQLIDNIIKEIDDIKKFDIICIYRSAIIKTNNLKTILKFPGIDRTKTYSNNFNIMSSVFGIEAAKNYHIYNSHQIFGNKSNARFIEIFSNYINSLGTPAGVVFGKSVKHGTGVFTRSTRERTFGTLAEEAYFGGFEVGGNVSTSQVLGTKVAVGTSYNPNFYDEEERLHTESIINEIPADSSTKKIMI